MTDHPFTDLAGRIGRVFVLTMSAAAFVLAPLLLALAIF